MNIQAPDIKVGDCAPRTARGDRIIAFIKQQLNSTQSNITLRISTSVPYRESAPCVVSVSPRGSG